MGKWITYHLTPLFKQPEPANGWVSLGRRIPVAEIAILHQRVSTWLKANCHHSTRCYRMYGETHWERGRIPNNTMEFGDTESYLRVKFRSKRDATVFKLYFAEHIFEPDLTLPRAKPITVEVQNLALTDFEAVTKSYVDKIARAIGIPNSMLLNARG